VCEPLDEAYTTFTDGDYVAIPPRAPILCEVNPQSNIEEVNFDYTERF